MTDHDEGAATPSAPTSRRTRTPPSPPSRSRRVGPPDRRRPGCRRSTQPPPVQWGTPTADPPPTRRTAGSRRCRSRRRRTAPQAGRPAGSGRWSASSRSCSAWSAARSAACSIERLTDDTPGLVSGGLDDVDTVTAAPLAGRQRLGRRGRAAAAARARCRSPPSTRARRAAPPAPASCSTSRATSSPTTTSSRDAAEDDGPIEIVDQDGNRYERQGRRAAARSTTWPCCTPRRPRPAARPSLGRLAGAARRRRRRRVRLAAGPELDRHRRHRQRARPAGHDRRLVERVLLHQRGADRRRDQPRQLRRPAGRPARPGGRRELRHRHHRRHRRRRGRQHRRRLRDPDRAGPDHRRPDPAHRRGALPGHRRQGADRRDATARAPRIDSVQRRHPGRRRAGWRRTTWSPRSTASGSPTASR